MLVLYLKCCQAAVFFFFFFFFFFFLLAPGLLSADQPWGRGRCHPFRRSRSHLEEADDTGTPPAVTEAVTEALPYNLPWKSRENGIENAIQTQRGSTAAWKIQAAVLPLCVWIAFSIPFSLLFQGKLYGRYGLGQNYIRKRASGLLSCSIQQRL